MSMPYLTTRLYVAEDSLELLALNMQTRGLCLETGSEASTGVSATPGRGFRHMGVHHPINTYGHPASYARDFITLAGTNTGLPGT